jgi:uncharacterized coiled-coil protein SlyX
MEGTKDQSLKVSDDSTIQIPLRNLVGLLFGTAVGVLGYAELNSRITTLEYQQTMQDMVIDKNSHFVTNWPLGRLGELPADMRQTSAIESLEKRQAELEQMGDRINEMQIEMNKLSGQGSVRDEKLGTLFDIWNSSVSDQ